MTKLLNPSEVHFFSKSVYSLDKDFRDFKQKLPNSTTKNIRKILATLDKPTLTNPNFGAFSDFVVLSSTSGIFSYKLLSGFGFIAKGTGHRTGEWLLVTRGTNAKVNKYDVATDANIALKRGPKGHLVHAGFDETYKGYEQQLIQYLVAQGVKRPTVIHCVGHSLGGALANLNAALLQKRGYNVALYTLGSPRVGFLPFAEDITKHLNPKQIKRVMHPADPVPMVPVFPFVHASKDPSEFYVPSGHGGFISINHHLLDHGYSPVAKMTSWSNLKTNAQYEFDKSLMGQYAKQHGAKGSLSMLTLMALNDKLLELDKAMGTGIVSLLQTGCTVNLSIIDRVSALLGKASQLNGQSKKLYVEVINNMEAMLGRPTGNNPGKSESIFLRGLLNYFNTSVGGLAAQAMQKASKG